MIQVQNLSKSYGSNRVLNELNLDLVAGKITGIIGANGAGKTTLFKCIAGLHKYDGNIYSDSAPIRNQLGFLQTNPEIMSRITAWEYLKLMNIARNNKSDDFEKQNIFELPLNKYAEHYSTGMKKKLALMAILIQKNEIFILDEPFNGVDIHSNLIINSIIKTLKKKNKIVIISSHLLSSLTYCCDEIHVLKDGQIKETYLPSEFAKLEASMESNISETVIDKLNI